MAALEHFGGMPESVCGTSPADAPLLGQRVVLSGLSARPELNGRRGEARSFEGGRYAAGGRAGRNGPPLSALHRGGERTLLRLVCDAPGSSRPGGLPPVPRPARRRLALWRRHQCERRSAGEGARSCAAAPSPPSSRRQASGLSRPLSARPRRCLTLTRPAATATLRPLCPLLLGPARSGSF